MDRVRLMPLELPPASSINTNGTGKTKSSFLRRLALGFGLLAILGLLYVPAYHSAQGSLQGLAQLPGWAYNTTRDIRAYIQPESNTTIIAPIGICTVPPYLIIIICSSALNLKTREAIRNTWASKVNTNNVYNMTVEVGFLVGENNNETLSELLEAENAQFKDIIQEKFYDSYNNLTIKSVMMLKWVTSNCGQAKYLMKTDDDMFVNVPALVKHLQTRPSPSGALIGSLICNAKPIADSKNKWYMPKYMYSERTYPNYLSGTGYVMSMDVAVKLYETALETPLIYLEDVYVTGICAKRAKLHPSNHPGFSFAVRKFDPCVFQTLITAHKVSPTNLYTMWQKIHDKNVKCPNSSPDQKKGNLIRKGRNAGHYSVRRRTINKCV
ncbi:beta-1,3-galactosyltransferase 1-like isoform X2 [Athalia rosae]|uniref:beta-1,3-galactosyltransferase 1-like isoform X2 n=1 Tax=Athalia rosae TaxID=37344 RepID=UPI002033C753|nr:beta-1,3-galactosyltransferase 1-like isoform X2 [Athalia rosae]